jgi:hypothetical protein
MIPEDEQANYELFRDALSSTILQNIAFDTPKERRRAKGRHIKSKSKDVEAEKREPAASGERSQDALANSDAEDLAEFLEVRD